MPFRTGKRRISIHAPAKGATPRSYHVTSISSDFNPRSREGSDAFVNVIALQHIPDFNPRSREGSDKKGQAENVCPFYFNPRSREGSDKHLPLRHCKRYISIHAPAKGATQHNSSRLVPVHNFNPRSREGSDAKVVKIFVCCGISIHAPAKGATMMSWCWGKAIRFQSTLPRRERLVTVICCLTSGYFNPRSREGSDKGSK